MIIKNLTTGATRSGITHSPEVIAGADPGKALSGHTDLAKPNICGFVVFFKNRNPEFFRWQTVTFGQQCPSMLDGLTLEVVAKTEVTQHLEKCMVPGGITNVIEIVMLAACTYAPLGGDRPMVGPFLLAKKHILELHHPRIGKQQRGIVMGHQRTAWHDFVPLCSKIIQKLLSYVPGLHFSSATEQRSPVNQTAGENLILTGTLPFAEHLANSFRIEPPSLQI